MRFFFFFQNPCNFYPFMCRQAPNASWSVWYFPDGSHFHPFFCSFPPHPLLTRLISHHGDPKKQAPTGAACRGMPQCVGAVGGGFEACRSMPQQPEVVTWRMGLGLLRRYNHGRTQRDICWSRHPHKGPGVALLKGSKSLSASILLKAMKGLSDRNGFELPMGPGGAPLEGWDWRYCARTAMAICERTCFAGCIPAWGWVWLV